jgi:hypothetical protein
MGWKKKRKEKKREKSFFMFQFGKDSKAEAKAAAVRACPTVPLAIEMINGIECMRFTYTCKGQTVEHQVRIDTETVQVNDNFKMLNSVYPNANCPKDKYQGNRYLYETTGIDN